VGEMVIKNNIKNLAFSSKEQENFCSYNEKKGNKNTAHL
jgi:hypothetical protein